MRFRAACLTFSTPAAALLKERLGDVYDIIREQVLANDASVLQAELIDICDRGDADVIFTSGGTGLTHNDRTPQATAAILDFEIPGIAEAIRARASRHDASAMLSRIFAGVRHKTLIINLPGNPKALAEALDVVLPILPTALEAIV
jgi:molybdopterin adenylyltransferase